MLLYDTSTLNHIDIHSRADAKWTNDKLDKKIVTGIIIKAISLFLQLYGNQKQKTLTLSNCEANYMAFVVSVQKTF